MPAPKIGPHSLPRDRADYGLSLSDSWKEQTLLNIVKVRYVPAGFRGRGEHHFQLLAFPDSVSRRILSAKRNEWRDRGWCGGILRQPNRHLHTVDRECLRI